MIVVWVGLLVIVVLVSMLAKRTAFPEPVLLVPTGLLLSMLPRFPQVELNPDVVFNALLPLLIYSAATTVSWQEFRRNVRPIGLLSIGLVLFTTSGVAWLAHYLIPGFSWPVAFALGAIISPPDDIAGIAVTKRLPIPQRIVTILAGEGLVNDATALTVFRFSIIAATSSAFNVWQAPLYFIGTLTAGAAYGLLVGWGILRIRALLNDPSLEVTLSLITPFIAFMGPEHFGSTGILSTVTAGMVVGAQAPRLIPSRTRIQWLPFWQMIDFWLNSLLFLLLGLQMRKVIVAVSNWPVELLASYGLGISLLIIVLRFIWVYSASYLTRLGKSANAGTGDPSWRHLFFVGWAGIRGAISLAAAFTIPLSLPNGQAFPMRDLIIFITFCVIIVTLVLQGLSLPFLIRWLGLTPEGMAEQDRATQMELDTRGELIEAGLRHLDELVEKKSIATETAAPYRQQLHHHRLELEHVAQGRRNGKGRHWARRDFTLHQEIIDAERHHLLMLHRKGKISDDVLHLIERDLDLQEVRLQQHMFSGEDS